MGRNSKEKDKTYKIQKTTKYDLANESYEKINAKTYNITIEDVPEGFENGEIKAKEKRVPIVPDHLPRLHTLCGAFGVVRSGKTHALTNLIQQYWNHDSINRIYIISPTYSSNFALQTLPVKKEDVYESVENAVQSMDNILGKIKKDVDEWEKEDEYRKTYKKWQKVGDEGLKMDEYYIMYKNGYRTPKKIPWPQPAIFIDDMTHTKLMSRGNDSVLCNLALRHRHLHGVGVSIFQAFQSFKGGMPKVIRSNMSLILIFPTCNMTEIEDMYTEVSNGITFETFKELLNAAFSGGEHNFLLINKYAKDPNRMFGINFDKVFVIDQNEERRKLLKMDVKEKKRSSDTLPDAK